MAATANAAKRAAPAATPAAPAAAATATNGKEDDDLPTPDASVSVLSRPDVTSFASDCVPLFLRRTHARPFPRQSGLLG